MNLSDGFFDYVNLAVGFIKSHTTILQGEESMVATHADVGAGVEACATLTDNDVTCYDDFAAEFFNAEALCVAVASVA